MDWASLGKKLIALGAPVVGGALGGPAGAAVGGAIGAALGVDAEPAAVEEAVAADPAALDRINDLAPQVPALIYAEMSRQLSEVNRTMRAELVAHSPLQRLWRPLWGLGANLVWTATGIALVAAIVVAIVSGEPAGFTAIATALGYLMWFYTAPLAVLGVVAWGRTSEKTAALAGKTGPGLIEAVAGRIAGGGR